MLNVDLVAKFAIDKKCWAKEKFGSVVFEPKESVQDPISEGIEHIVGLEHIDSEDIRLHRSSSIDKITTFTKKFSIGDVLFGRRRAYLKKAAVANFEGICSGDITVLRAREGMLLPELLPFIVNNERFFDYAITHSAGGLSPRVKFKDLSNYELWLPSLDKQKELCELLVSVENLLQQNIKLFKSSKKYKESVIEANLTTQLSGGTLSDYCDSDGVKIGPFGSLLHKTDYSEKGVPVIMPADIVDGVIQEESVARISEEKAQELKNYRLKESDIIFPRRGDLTKRAIIAKHQEGWICGTGSLRVRLKKGVDPRIVYYAVTSASTNHWLLASSVGTTMPNLNAGTIKKIPLHLPDGPNSGRILSNIEMAISSANSIGEHVIAIRRLKDALIKKVF